MSDNLKELDHIGPAREERLEEEGYETYEDLANADYETLSREVQRLPEDTALEVVVQAQNMLSLEESDVEENPDIEEGVTVDDSSSEEAVAEDETDSTESGDILVSVEFADLDEYNAFFGALLNTRNSLKRTNRAGVLFYEDLLEEMSNTDLDGEFSVEMSGDKLNDLHSSLVDQRTTYQADNLIDMMDAINQIKARINLIREDELF